MSKHATCGSSGLRSRDDADRRQIVRLVQRRERHELLELAQHSAVDQRRLGEVEPAVHHAMADRRPAGSLRAAGAQKLGEIVDRAVVAQAGAARPRLRSPSDRACASFAVKRGAV